MSKQPTAVDLVARHAKDLLVAQRVRLHVLLCQIYECEGDIILRHWCADCNLRWAKIWDLIEKFKRRNDVDRQYARRVLGVMNHLHDGPIEKERFDSDDAIGV